MEKDISKLENIGIDVEIMQTPFEFQTGSRRMMRLSRNHGGDYDGIQ